jgi:SAM-dependent methyltransferase
MNAQNLLKEVLEDNRSVRLVEEDIYSALPDVSRQHHYDRRATVYDLLVGTRLYNSIMWGSSPLDYVAFARQAVASCLDGEFLDAGCGSLLFTATVYLECDKQIVAFDQSLAMLRRARKRLLKLNGSMPQHILLLQADLSDLPFRPAGFQTVLCMNVLHHLEDAAGLMPSLERLLVDGGRLFLTSLVSNRRFIGDSYLNALHLTKEFARPRSSLELQEVLNESLNRGISFRVKGNMAFVATKA